LSYRIGRHSAEIKQWVDTLPQQQQQQQQQQDHHHHHDRSADGDS
jgi:hypothetical protein